MGLLDAFGQGFDSPQSAMIQGLAQGLLSGDFGAGLGMARKGAMDAKRGLLADRMGNMQMQLLQSQVAENQAQAQARQAEAARQQRIQTGLPGLFTRPGMTGGAPVPQEIGGVPMFSQPMGASPMRSTPGGFDIQRAITELGMKPAEAKAYAELAQFGKPKVARTIEIMRDGKPTTIQVDERGQEVGSGYEQWKAPVFQNLGGRTAAIDPVSLGERGSFAQSQSPDNKASVGASYANAGATREVANATRDAARIQTGFKNEQDLRKEFSGLPEVENYKKAYPAFAAIKDATSRNTTQSDINIVYGLAKLYDPTSVVREGEYATVANSPNIPEKVKGYAQYLAGGGRLSPETKKQIMLEATGRIGTYEAEAKKARGSYEGIAKKRGMEPSSVFSDMGDMNQGSPAAPQGKTVKRTGKYGGKKVTEYSDGSIVYAD